MRGSAFFIVIIMVLGFLAPASSSAAVANPGNPGAGAEEREGIEFFEKHIRPLLAEHCYKCHSARADKRKGGLLLDTYDGWMNGGDTGPVIVPNQPGRSLLIKAVRYTDDDLQMPPKYRLSDEEVRRLEQWVKMGAPDPRQATVPGAPAAAEAPVIDFEAAKSHWAYQPLTQPDIPTVKDQGWPRTDIDRFLLASMEKAGLTPVADADRRVLIRRLYFDLIGLPPTPEAVNKFIADKDPRAIEKLVDELLARPEFGQRWGRHWLDVARYAESTGQTRNYPYNYAWRYRDYVINSFNADKPYDLFIREQIAGDLMPADSPQQRDQRLIATGYLALGSKDLNERNRMQFDMDNVDEQIDTIGRGVLALTVSCARCHDHKFDPIPTTDYYAVAGIFKSTDILFGLGLRKGNNNGFNPANMIKLTAEQTAQSRAAMQELQAKINALNEEYEDADRARRRTNDPGERREAQREMNRIQREIDEVREDAEGKVQLAMGAREGDEPRDIPVMIRGDIDNRGRIVQRGFLRILCQDQPELSGNSSGRLEFAQWLTNPDSPAGQLAARVMVNRIWSHLFGAGIVPTVDNYGAMGLPPSHPELLDHLAVKFIDQGDQGDQRDQGWSVKKLIRAIVLTRAYQLSSDHNAANYDKDPDNIYLWRSIPRRLDAEALRDAMLAVSGQLDLSIPEGSMVQDLPPREIRNGLDDEALQSVRRTVYMPIVRSMLPDFLETFDFAEPSSVNGERDITTVAPQALLLMNSPFVTAQAQAFATNLLDREGLDDFARVEAAYERALCRKPTSAERQRVIAYLDEFTQSRSEAKDDAEARAAAWASFCQALFASAEFRYLN